MANDEQMLRDLFSKIETRLRNRYRNLLESALTIEVLEQAIRDNTLRGTLNEIYRNFAASFANAVTDEFVVAGQSTADFISNVFQITTTFDQTDSQALQIMRANRLRLIRGLTNEQRQSVSLLLTEALEEGINPKKTARLIKDRIGLTPRQIQSVRNYRRLLETSSADALKRELRDRRFDSTVRRAVRLDKPLTTAQIDKMVGRYNERMLRQRATTIAQTETVKVMNQGNLEMYRQAIANGHFEEDELVHIWRTAGDARVRDSHSTLNGTKKPVGEVFVSGNGNRLRHPGDPLAPANDIINCRCILSTRVRTE